MNREEFYQEWIKRLRSGDYAQCQFRLKIGKNDFPVQYCCLGVASEILVEQSLAKWGPLRNLDSSYTLYDVKSHMFSNTFIPDELRNVLHLRDCEVGYLTELNDIGKKSFSDIANVIEKEFLPYVSNGPLIRR